MFVMGRRVPADNLLLLHPLLYLSFFAVGFAASVAIVTAICGVRFRKKPSPRSPSSDPLETAKDLDASTPPSNTVAIAKSPEHPKTGKSETEHMTETENNEMQIKELPLPPAMQQPKDSFPSNNMMKRATSERRASFSLSHPKNSSSMSISRQCSFLDPDALSIEENAKGTSIFQRAQIEMERRSIKLSSDYGEKKLETCMEQCLEPHENKGQKIY